MTKTRRAMAERPQRVTIADIAKHVGVSTATVSYAINQPSRVSAGVVLQVNEAIALLGYRGNAAARQLRVGRSEAIALIVNDASNPAFTAFAAAAETEAALTGRFILLANSSDDPTRELAYLRFFESQQVGGIVLAPVGEVPEELSEIANRGTPVVSLGNLGGASSVPFVSGDDHAGGVVAMKHLIHLGRRTPLFVGGPLPQFRYRHQGAEQVAAAAGRVLESHALAAATVKEAFRAISAMPLEQLLSFDSVFAGNDLLAIGVLHALHDRGVRVPEQIAVIGYDDIEFAELAIVPLTTVRHDAAAMGRAAIRTAIGPKATTSQTYPPQLVVRRSTVS
ncbi:LacI family DNA-binding transcriptional regulator [Microbacterium sp. NPDC076911]|uniref:LacI family DNA-binding transcriptional regulator n=1 Tax=Microbacterium sp. NPDC076911 TaxID=3154958 RepID=UPI0034392DFC